MSSYLDFERLVETTELIARHPDFPGKPEAVAQCREDIEDLSDSGRITVEQADILREILRGSRPRLACRH